MNIDIHSATGKIENAIKGRVHLNFYLCSNKGKLIKTCLVFFISALSFEAIIGADLLFHTKELISLNAQGLKFRINDKMHNVKIEKAKEVLKLREIPYITKKSTIIEFSCSKCNKKDLHPLNPPKRCLV
jgi:hypothetical protein